MKFNSKKRESLSKHIKMSLRDKKHQANLRKSGGLYFQIGLVASLFIIFGVFQAKFYKKEVVVNPIKITETNDYIIRVPDFIVEENIPKVKMSNTTTQVVTSWENPKIVENNSFDVETVISKPTVPVDVTPKISDIHVDDSGEEPEIDTFPVSLVSDLPVFPGCESYTDKQQLLECFSNKVSRHVNKKFDTDVAIENGVQGKQKIFVTFVINSKGDVVNVKARAPHPELQKEAVKAVSMLPRMTPAKQGFKTVNVTYSLPIIFEVQ
ncbi:MAG: energy transducer TonB [Flavobacteriaceae bacterium]